MVVSEIRSLYRDAESLLFHTVIKRIWEQLVGDRWVGRKVEIIYGDGEPVQPIEYRDGWIIPPGWEFMSQKWTYKRKPMQETVYDHNSEVGVLR